MNKRLFSLLVIASIVIDAANSLILVRHNGNAARLAASIPEHNSYQGRLVDRGGVPRHNDDFYSPEVGESA